MSIDKQVLEGLARVSTASITTILFKKGLRKVWFNGARPLQPGQPRVVGPAFTLRFIPAREDLATPAMWSSPRSTRAAVEAMPEGCITVIDAMGVTDAGVYGDILCARMQKRGVAGLITDGVVRDIEGVVGSGLPVWCQGTAAPPAVSSMTFVNWQEPIGCGGVAVFPDDIVVADADGAVLVPAAYVEEVVTLGLEQEKLEAWILDEVKSGAALSGLYPPDEANMKRYEASLKR